MRKYQVEPSVSEPIGTRRNFVDGSNPQTIFGLSGYSSKNMDTFSAPLSSSGKRAWSNPWWLEDVEETRSGSKHTIYRSGYWTHPTFVGELRNQGHHLTSGTPVWDTVRSSYDAVASSLSTYSASAFNRMRPDLPSFSIAQQLGELREVPGSLKRDVRRIRDTVRDKSGKTKLSRTAEWHLSLQFGWLPLLSSVRDFVKAHRDSQKRLRKLIDDASKPKRRSTRLDGLMGNSNKEWVNNQTFSNGYGAPHFPSLVTQAYGGGPSYQTTTTTLQVRTWATGTFTYWLPPGPRDYHWNRKLYRRIMGMYVTPSVIYELVPWSWLVDYFTTCGDFYKAVSAGVADRCVAKNLCMMQTVTLRNFTKCRIPVVVGNNFSVFAETFAVRTMTRKFRMPGSPFGWGVRHSDLSLHQKGILAALGLSRWK